MSEKDKNGLSFICGGEVQEVEVKYRYIPSMEEQKEASKKFTRLLSEKNTHVSELLKAYFNDYEMMELDDFDHETYQYYLNIYSYDDLNHVVDELKIKDNENRWQMALAIITAASRYDSWIERLRRKPKVKVYKESMKRLSSALRKAYKELDPDMGCEDVESIYQFHFTRALTKQISNKCENEHSVYNTSNILKNINSRGYINDFDLGLFIEVMADVAEEQEKEPPFETEKHEEPIHMWFVNIAYSWEEYSDLPLKVAKYYKDVGYVSDQMKLLEDMMKLLDPNITNAQIGNALKVYLSDRKSSIGRLNNFL